MIAAAWRTLLIKVAGIVFVSLILDCAILYFQARAGRRLLFRLRLFPDIGGQF